MKNLTVVVGRTKKNYSAVVNEEINGMVIVTADTLEELKVKLRETIDVHLESLDEGLQEWMYNKEYDLIFVIPNESIL